MASSFANLWNKWTGKDMTDAQKAVNSFNAAEAQKARDFEQQMSNTSYQRQLADMEAAGVNPALAMGGNANGASTPSGEAAAAGSDPSGGLGMSDLMNVLLAPLSVAQGIKGIQDMTASIKNKNADVEVKNANIRKIDQEIKESEARTTGIEGNNKWLEQFNQDRHRAYEDAHNMSEEQQRNLAKQREVADKNIDLLIAQAATEKERKSYIKAQRVTEMLRGYEIVELLPYKKALMNAQTEAQRASAKYQSLMYLIEHNKLDKGYYDSLIAEAEARARIQLTEAQRKDIYQSMRDGTFIEFDFIKSDSDSDIASVWNTLVDIAEGVPDFGLGVVTTVLDYVGSALGGILSGAAAAVK